MKMVRYNPTGSALADGEFFDLRNVGKSLDHVLGYVLGIDFSERDFRFNRGGQGFKGKSCETFAPLGPWVAMRGEFPIRRISPCASPSTASSSRAARRAT